MAYSFKEGDGTLQDGLRRVALSQIDAALGELGDDDIGLDARVHQLRKRCKKIRGLVRLVRPGFDDYAAENAAFRDAARGLSELRDDSAMVETVDRLAARFGDQADAGFFERVKRDLRKGGRRAPARALERFRADMRAARDRAETWAVEDSGKVLAKGLQTTFGRSAAAMEAALVEPSAGNLHRWRKRVKYHWYHARLLKRAGGGLTDGHRDNAEELASLLGDHHDLAVLAGELDAVKGRDGAAMLGLIRRRQAELASRAFKIGRFLHAERPKALARRWRGYWQAWRAGPPAVWLVHRAA